MRSVAVTALLSAGLLIAGCGGGGARSTRVERPAAPTAGPTAATGPTTSTGIRSLATVEACLASNHIPATPYAPPAGAPATARAGPHVLLVMPWAAVQITIYSATVASSSSIAQQDAGAVMSSGNVSLALDQMPEPPPSVMSVIQACAFGRRA